MNVQFIHGQPVIDVDDEGFGLNRDSSVGRAIVYKNAYLFLLLNY